MPLVSPKRSSAQVLAHSPFHQRWCLPSSSVLTPGQRRIADELVLFGWHVSLLVRRVLLAWTACLDGKLTRSMRLQHASAEDLLLALLKGSAPVASSQPGSAMQTQS